MSHFLLRLKNFPVRKLEKNIGTDELQNLISSIVSNFLFQPIISLVLSCDRNNRRATRNQ